VGEAARTGTISEPSTGISSSPQANKARRCLRHFGTIHSVDSAALARAPAKRIASEEGLSPRLFFLKVKLRPGPRQDRL